MNENPLTVHSIVASKVPVSKFAARVGAVQTTLLEVYLHPGQHHVAAKPTNLKMILGSCAGVFLFDSTLEIGGATHFMLPFHGEGSPSPRYGDVALAGLLEEFLAMGSCRRNMQAKIFGGASMLQALQDLSARIGQIGRRNVEIAFEILGRESITVVEKCVFGNRARTVSMVSNTGEIKIEFVSRADGNQ